MKDKIWGDYYNRYDFIKSCEKVVDSCVKMEKPMTFSLEGDWGKGKSWVIKKLEESIKGLDIAIDNSENLLKANNGKYLVFTYNSWEKDFYEEPLVGILITLVNQLNDVLLIKNMINEKRKELIKQTMELLEGVLSKISQKLLGVDIIDAGKRSFKKLKELKKQSEIKLNMNGSDNIENDIKVVVESLNKLSKQLPIVFIIDELDRCVPERAIKTLERLHHVFGKIKSSVTIISIYRKQLENSIKLMFGDKISLEKYLSKFIDFSINIESGIIDYEQVLDNLKTLKEKFSIDGDDKVVELILNNVHKNINAREFEKICKNAFLCHEIVNKDSSLLPKECFAAEMFLFACKLTEEVEKNSSGFSPECGNDCSTNLGRYLREFLIPLQRKPLPKNQSQNIVMFIVSLVYGFSRALAVAEESIDDKEKLELIKEYYSEYRAIFKMIK